ncbi:MAG: hypothetical protein NVS2B11_07060 [Acetobacteraceae bacterium]
MTYVITANGHVRGSCDGTREDAEQEKERLVLAAFARWRPVDDVANSLLDFRKAIWWAVQELPRA